MVAAGLGDYECLRQCGMLTSWDPKTTHQLMRATSSQGSNCGGRGKVLYQALARLRKRRSGCGLRDQRVGNRTSEYTRVKAAADGQ